MRRPALLWTGLLTLTWMSTASAQAPRPLSPERDGSRLHMQEVLSIGSEDGEHDTFARITGAAFGPSGRIYVADGQNHRVAVFDRDGRFVGEVARRGKGPGELESPGAMAVDARDSLFVWDVAQARITVFGPDLAYRRSFSVPADWVVNGIEILPDGQLLLAAYARGSRNGLHLLERTGRVRASFGPGFPSTDLAGFESSLLGGTLDVGEGTIAYSKKSPYEVTFFDAAGRVRSSCRGEEKLTTRPAAVVVRNRDGTGLQWNRYVHSASILALGGGLYLNVIRDPVNDRRILDVITPDCRLVRRAEVEGPLTFFHRSGDRLLGARTLDYPEVVIYRYSVRP